MKTALHAAFLCLLVSHPTFAADAPQPPKILPFDFALASSKPLKNSTSKSQSWVGRNINVSNDVVEIGIEIAKFRKEKDSQGHITLLFEVGNRDAARFRAFMRKHNNESVAMLAGDELLFLLQFSEYKDDIAFSFRLNEETIDQIIKTATAK